MSRRSFTAQDALRATSALRAELGEGAESFPLEAFVGMISDEVEALRKAGRSDAEISRMLAEKAQVEISAEDIAAHYAPPEARGHPG